MVEIASTTDAIRLSFLRATLQDAGIDCAVFDAASPWPGAIPARLMVAERDAWRARHAICDAEAAAELR